YIRPDVPFNDRLMKVGFWCLNIGLALMLVLSLIPVGILQSIASIQYGLWFARSESFMQEPLLQVLRWMRMLGDTIFIIGAACFFAQVVMMIKGKRKD
ncbi:MAG: nitric-oxide reductase large subunit, partial [Veillonella sp.]|nr:nitric-oxide reductase large subunit [Veillonella sp.]